jgi:hypothetical protein
MTQMPTLEEMAALLEAQDAELATAAELAATIPDGLSVDERFVEAFDEVTEPRAQSNDALPPRGIRA